MKTFGEQLADARKAKGLTQDQLAAEMNITRQGVSRWENGRTLPDAETMKRLSQVLEYNFVSDEPIVLVHEEPAPADVSAQDEHLETAEAEEKTVEHMQISRQQSLIRCALCLAVGLVLGCLTGVYLLPHPDAAPVSVNINTNAPEVGALPAQMEYQPEVEGQAYLSIFSMESPVKAIRTSENDASWFYTIVVRNTGELSFTMESMTQYGNGDNGQSGAIRTFSPADLGLGDGVIMPGCELSFGGGFPVQPMKGLHITITGTDASGAELSFEGEIELSKEIAE